METGRMIAFVVGKILMSNLPLVVRLLPLLGVLAIASRASAQNAFAVNEDGQLRLVKEVRNGYPWTEVGGKLQPSYGGKFTLTKMPFYRPGLITFSKFVVKIHHLNLIRAGARVNYEVRIQGRVTSDVALKNCFFVLEMTSWKDSGVIFADMPDLEAGKEKDFELNSPLQIPLEEGHYRVHVFSDGAELLHSKMPAGYLAAQKQKTDELSSGRMTEFAAVPIHKPRAVYPAGLAAKGVEGVAKVRCRINARGQVVSAEVVECNDPAFSEPALAAVRQWEFDPAVKDLHLVESTEVVSLRIKPSEPTR
jgi:TonB family protein